MARAARVKVPRRGQDFRDPLGQTYYRRLSLTENVVQATPLAQYPPVVQESLLTRRNTVRSIPLDFSDGAAATQCMIPNQSVIKNLIPSFVRYIAGQNQRPDRQVASVRVYRVTHMITPPDQFVGAGDSKVGTDLNDFTTYKPYYQGQFDKNGELIDPADPMLYWLVPIRRNPSARPEDFARSPRGMTMKAYKDRYLDFVIEHAGSNHMEGELE